jgi:hypothetical protein
VLLQQTQITQLTRAISPIFVYETVSSNNNNNNQIPH